jgi:hypothetical protein
MAEEKERICGMQAARRDELERLRRELADAEELCFTEDRAKTFRERLLPLVEEVGCTVVLAVFAGAEEPQTIPDPNEPVAVLAAPVHLTVLGQHDQIVALLERLRTHRPRAWVDTCRIAAFDEHSSRLECDLDLTLYTIREERMPGDQ